MNAWSRFARQKGERTSLIAAALHSAPAEMPADKYAESAVPAGGWSEQGTPPPTTALQRSETSEDCSTSSRLYSGPKAGAVVHTVDENPGVVRG